MSEKAKQILNLVVAIGLCLIFGSILLMYAKPMEDISLDLTMAPIMDGEEIDPERFDSKGWTVYTQEGDTITELEPDGFGGFTGLELGQTFYYSRVMEEQPDSPTLQIGAANRTFSVWLDGQLIYTDRPEADNRIGHLHLPMNQWDRLDPLTLTLPMDYYGKTLTIAQSFSEYSETGSVRAYPSDVTLYCGYAYESGLVSESFRTAILAGAAFLLGLILLMIFVRSQDRSILYLSLVPFLWMVSQLLEAPFFFRYFGTFDNSPTAMLPLISSGAVLFYLVHRSERHKKILWGIVAAYALSVIVALICLWMYPDFSHNNKIAYLLIGELARWIAFTGLVSVMILGIRYWRKENRFYQNFCPIASAAILIYWAARICILDKGQTWSLVMLMLQSGQINYVYHNTMTAVTAAVLITAIAEALHNELARQTEKHLLEQKQEIALSSYENIRRQHKEVMMLRHDMMKHFHTLQAMSSEVTVKEYLTDLIGQNTAVRPVVQTGNEVLDIILNSKLSTAKDAGIPLEIKRACAPAALPLRDTDLCSLVMNMIDNAIAGATGVDGSFIRLDIHTASGQLVIVCENACETAAKKYKEPLPGHGLGMKIIRSITQRYGGIMDVEKRNSCFRIRILLPLS